MQNEIELAEEAMKNRDWPEAVNRWRKVISTYKFQVPPQVYVLLSIAHRFQSQSESAEDVLRQGLEIYPGDISILSEYAGAAKLKKDWSETSNRLKMLRHAVAVKEKSIDKTKNHIFTLPPVSGLEAAINAIKILHGFHINAIHSYYLEQIEQGTIGPDTHGVFRIRVKVKDHQNGKEQQYKLIAKGITHKGEVLPREADILSDPVFCSPKNPARPPHLFHMCQESGIIWLFMEEIHNARNICDWKNQDYEHAGRVFGRFNAEFSGDKLSDLRFLSQQSGRYEPGIPKFASSIIKSLYEAGHSGYTIALKAAKSLERFIANHEIFVGWLSRQPVCLCHFDPHLDNIFPQSGHDLPRIIDWQSYQVCPIGFEPAAIVWASALRGWFFINKDALMHGYRQGLMDAGMSPSEDLDALFAFHVVQRAMITDRLANRWDAVRIEGGPRPDALIGDMETLVSITRLIRNQADFINKAIF
jgi:hypothetical protein